MKKSDKTSTAGSPEAGRPARCRLSQFGVASLLSGNPAREGDFLGITRTGLAKVRWDGTKGIHSYHPSFVEGCDQPTVDLGGKDLLEERTRPVDDMRAAIRGKPTYRRGVIFQPAT